MGEVKKFLSAKEVLAVEDVETVDVEVPEWGGTIRLRMLTGEEAVSFAESVKGKDDKAGAARIVVRCAVDENNARIFSDEDIDVLKGKSMRALLRVQKVALEINGLSDEAVNKVKEG